MAEGDKGSLELYLNASSNFGSTHYQSKTEFQYE